MKKFLSLVLALVMTMSLVTVSAGAKDFTDSSKIQYKEAIDVMSAVKVIDGYADGAFNPANTLTRGAAAKIICNLLLGPTTASALVADAAPYSDVPTSNVFAGYIAYCQKEGIISGYADGTFRPAGTLTGYAFMKMLLGALGYDATIEGYIGANWSINVAKRALNIGLDDGLVNDFNGVKAVTREEACLYAFNMLQATMVEYDSTTNITVGGAQVVIAGSKAKDVETNSDKATIKGNANKPGTVEFGEKYFSKLKKTKGAVIDAFGRPSTQWTYKGEEVGTYAQTPDVTYAKSVKLADIYADLKMSSKDKTATLYENGLKTATDLVVAKDADNDGDKLSKLGNKMAGDGTIVEVFRDDDTNHVDICVISVYVGEVTRTKDATKTKDAYVVVDAKSTVDKKANKSFKNEFKTTEFAEDDIVAFTYSAKDNEIKTMYKLDSVEGELTKRAIGSSMTLGENTYKFNKNIAYGDTLTDDTSMATKGTYTVYVDKNGYALYVEETDAAIENYAMVIAIESSTGAFSNDRAKLVFTDGTVKTVNLAKDYVNKDDIGAGSIVVAKADADGDYKLTAKAQKDYGSDNANFMDATNSTSANADFKLTKKDATVKVGPNKADKKYADSKTVFVVKQGTDDWKTYTGIKNVPSVDADASNKVAFFCKSGDTLSVVFVYAKDSTKVHGSSKDITFIAGESRSDRLVDIDDNDYYEYNAVVNGKITTVKIDTTGSVDGLEQGDKTNKLYNDVTTSDDMVIGAQWKSDKNVKPYNNLKGIKKMTGEYSIQIKGATLTVAENAKIFYVDTDGNITEVALKDIKTDVNDRAYYTLEDGEITNLFVVEVKG